MTINGNGQLWLTLVEYGQLMVDLGFIMVDIHMIMG